MLSDNLKKLRQKKGITQEELAIRIGVVRQTVSKWEKGLSVPDAEILQKIADELESTVQEILGAEIVAEDDKNEIATQLSRINEQMAVRNKRIASAWQLVSIILIICILTASVIALVKYKTDSDRNNSNVTENIANKKLPDVVEITSYNINIIDDVVICTAVPSVGDSGFKYYMIAHCNSENTEDIVKEIKCENGSCVGEFNKYKLMGQDYTIILQICSETDKRNVSILKSLTVNTGGNGYGWVE